MTNRTIPKWFVVKKELTWKAAENPPPQWGTPAKWVLKINDFWHIWPNFEKSSEYELFQTCQNHTFYIFLQKHTENGTFLQMWLPVVFWFDYHNWNKLKISLRIDFGLLCDNHWYFEYYFYWDVIITTDIFHDGMEFQLRSTPTGRVILRDWQEQ